MVATAGDEVQIVVAVVAMQALRHPARVDTGVRFDCDLGLRPIVTNPLVTDPLIRTKRE